MAFQTPFNVYSPFYQKLLGLSTKNKNAYPVRKPKLESENKKIKLVVRKTDLSNGAYR